MIEPPVKRLNSPVHCVNWYIVRGYSEVFHIQIDMLDPPPDVNDMSLSHVEL